MPATNITPTVAFNDSLAAEIRRLIEAFVDAPENQALCLGMAPWRQALVGIAGGADPLFGQFKQAVGPGHWTPAEALELAFPGQVSDPAEVSVVCWVLPHAKAVRKKDADGLPPWEQWAFPHKYTEAFNRALRRYMQASLLRQGVPAVAPYLLPDWTCVASEAYNVVSHWSERHMAYAAGLGTFGLCDGLITRAGKSMRCGSVVLAARLRPTPRTYTDRHAYCMHYTKGGCTACIRRCPAGAISAAGHDKQKCKDFLKANRLFGGKAYGAVGQCGMCQVGVPCEVKGA